MTFPPPFPYFGGKRLAAPIVWGLLGDVGSYVEPFAGSLGVLLNRPPVDGARSEIVNDKDGLLINAWRAMRYAPDVVADHLEGIVSEVNYHAKMAWLQQHRHEFQPLLEGDPEWCDPKLAAWWLDVMACALEPFATGRWVRQLGDDGLWRLVDAGRMDDAGIEHSTPCMGGGGRGVNRTTLGDPHEYMHKISARLQGVRILCRDWARILASKATLNGTAGNKQVGIFLDPPYSVGTRCYNDTDRGAGIDVQVREWCKQADPEYRIVLCGYDSDHDELLEYGWHKTLGRRGGAGFDNGKSQRQEMLWHTPNCLTNTLM